MIKNNNSINKRNSEKGTPASRLPAPAYNLDIKNTKNE